MACFLSEFKFTVKSYYDNMLLQYYYSNENKIFRHFHLSARYIVKSINRLKLRL